MSKKQRTLYDTWNKTPSQHVNQSSSNAFQSPKCQKANDSTNPEFDYEAGKTWIYPTNYPVRDYQFSIVKEALFKNTLVILPTGLGKTFIAAVVMYNIYRWYPNGKVVFMAPTKPLVAQQVDACFRITGIPQDDTVQMTGTNAPDIRTRMWQKKRVFFLTPQVLVNDLVRNICPASSIKCLVVDEAHKALGNHAYCQVIKELCTYTTHFRILALTATPGSEMQAVRQLLSNLLISHVEMRSEDSDDVQQYTHIRDIEKIVVPLGERLNILKSRFLDVINVYLKRLTLRKAMPSKNPASLSKYQILKMRETFSQHPPANIDRFNYGLSMADFSLCISLYHAYELLLLHGASSFYNFLNGILNGDKSIPHARSELLKNFEFNEIMKCVKETYIPNPVNPNAKDLGSKSNLRRVLPSHPKLEKLCDVVLNHFKTAERENIGETRVMIFTQYRDSVQEIVEMFDRHKPVVKVMSFVGQSSKTATRSGISQKQQLKVIQDFRSGGYNTLVSTCVGEEGLDIGEVDLIVCYDCPKSPIRLVQRMGRTGRLRKGHIIILVAEGKEEQMYHTCEYRKKSVSNAITKGFSFGQLYQNSPSLVPSNVKPVCVKTVVKIEPKKALLKVSAGSSKSPYLNEEELAEFDRHVKVEKSNIPLFPKQEYLLFKKTTDMEPLSKETVEETLLSLSNWTLWQTTPQRTCLIPHSSKSLLLTKILEYVHFPELLTSRNSLLNPSDFCDSTKNNSGSRFLESFHTSFKQSKITTLLQTSHVSDDLQLNDVSLSPKEVLEILSPKTVTDNEELSLVQCLFKMDLPKIPSASSPVCNFNLPSTVINSLNAEDFSSITLGSPRGPNISNQKTFQILSILNKKLKAKIKRKSKEFNESISYLITKNTAAFAKTVTLSPNNINDCDNDLFNISIDNFMVQPSPILGKKGENFEEFKGDVKKMSFDIDFHIPDIFDNDLEFEDSDKVSMSIGHGKENRYSVTACMKSEGIEDLEKALHTNNGNLNLQHVSDYKDMSKYINHSINSSTKQYSKTRCIENISSEGLGVENMHESSNILDDSSNQLSSVSNHNSTSQSVKKAAASINFPDLKGEDNLSESNCYLKSNFKHCSGIQNFEEKYKTNTEGRSGESSEFYRNKAVNCSGENIDGKHNLESSHKSEHNINFDVSFLNPDFSFSAISQNDKDLLYTDSNSRNITVPDDKKMDLDKLNKDSSSNLDQFLTSKTSFPPDLENSISTPLKIKMCISQKDNKEMLTLRDDYKNENITKHASAKVGNQSVNIFKVPSVENDLSINNKIDVSNNCKKSVYMEQGTQCSLTQLLSLLESPGNPENKLANSPCIRTKNMKKTSEVIDMSSDDEICPTPPKGVIKSKYIYSNKNPVKKSLSYEDSEKASNVDYDSIKVPQDIKSNIGDPKTSASQNPRIKVLTAGSTVDVEGCKKTKSCTNEAKKGETDANFDRDVRIINVDFDNVISECDEKLLFDISFELPFSEHNSDSPGIDLFNNAICISSSVEDRYEKNLSKVTNTPNSIKQNATEATFNSCKDAVVNLENIYAVNRIASDQNLSADELSFEESESLIPQIKKENLKLVSEKVKPVILNVKSQSEKNLVSFSNHVSKFKPNKKFVDKIDLGELEENFELLSDEEKMNYSQRSLGGKENSNSAVQTKHILHNSSMKTNFEGLVEQSDSEEGVLNNMNKEHYHKVKSNVPVVNQKPVSDDKITFDLFDDIDMMSGLFLEHEGVKKQNISNKNPTQKYSGGSSGLENFIARKTSGGTQNISHKNSAQKCSEGSGNFENFLSTKTSDKQTISQKHPGQKCSEASSSFEKFLSAKTSSGNQNISYKSPAEERSEGSIGSEAFFSAKTYDKKAIKFKSSSNHFLHDRDLKSFDGNNDGILMTDLDDDRHEVSSKCEDNKCIPKSSKNGFTYVSGINQASKVSEQAFHRNDMEELKNTDLKDTLKFNCKFENKSFAPKIVSKCQPSVSSSGINSCKRNSIEDSTMLNEACDGIVFDIGFEDDIFADGIEEHSKPMNACESGPLKKRKKISSSDEAEAEVTQTLQNKNEHSFKTPIKMSLVPKNDKFKSYGDRSYSDTSKSNELNVKSEARSAFKHIVKNNSVTEEDDEEDFHFVRRMKIKKDNSKKLKKIKKKNHKRNVFLLTQAEISASDESDHASLSEEDDILEGSFIDDDDSPCEMDHTDLQAFYMQSVKNTVGLPKQFKMKPLGETNHVFPTNSEANCSSYMFDSFCVDNEDVSYLTSDDESYAVKEKNKRSIGKVKKDNKKLKRVVMHDSTTSSEFEVSPKVSKSNVTDNPIDESAIGVKKKRHRVISSDEEEQPASKLKAVQPLSSASGNLINKCILKRTVEEKEFSVDFDDDFISIPTRKKADAVSVEIKNKEISKSSNSKRENSNIQYGDLLKSHNCPSTSKSINYILQPSNTVMSSNLLVPAAGTNYASTSEVNETVMPNSDVNISFDIRWEELIPAPVPSMTFKSSEQCQDSSHPTSNPLKKDNKGAQPTNILVDSRELASGKPVISALRSQHNINPIVMQLKSADYILSNRMAVERVFDSEFNSQSLPPKLVEKVRMMNEIYEKSVVIIERDMRKNILSFNKSNTKYLQFVVQLNNLPSVCILYSKSVTHTCELIFSLIQNERRRKFAIDVPVILNSKNQHLYEFYSSIPKVSSICALNFLYHFPTIESLLKSSVGDIKEKGCISSQKASHIHKYLRSELTYCGS